MNSEDIITTLLSNYNLGTLESSKEFLSGTVQKNIYIKTSKGEFVIKHYRTRSKQYVDFELKLCQYLNQHKFSCPILIKTKSGDLCVSHDNCVAAVLEYVEGRHLRKLNYDQVDQIIYKVAELHNITQNLKIEGVNNRWNYNIEFCKYYLNEHLAFPDGQSAKKKKQWIIEELDLLDLNEKMSKGVIHGDLDASNIIFKDQKLISLIDFDDANYSYLVLDIVGILDHRNYKFLGHKYFELIRYVFKKYQSVRKLTEEDKYYFYDVLKLSILIDTLWYFDRGTFPNYKEKEKIDQLKNIGSDRFNHKLKL